RVDGFVGRRRGEDWRAGEESDKLRTGFHGFINEVNAPHMTQATPSRGVLADDDCVAPGTNRLVMLRTYFEICGAAGVVVTVGMVVATLWFPEMKVTRGSHPLLPI